MQSFDIVDFSGPLNTHKKSSDYETKRKSSEVEPDKNTEKCMLGKRAETRVSK